VKKALFRLKNLLRLQVLWLPSASQNGEKIEVEDESSKNTGNRSSEILDYALGSSSSALNFTTFRVKRHPRLNNKTRETQTTRKRKLQNFKLPRFGAHGNVNTNWALHPTSQESDGVLSDAINQANSTRHGAHRVPVSSTQRDSPQLVREGKLYWISCWI
jgi:hypothetical protein